MNIDYIPHPEKAQGFFFLTPVLSRKYMECAYVTIKSHTHMCLK